MARGSGQWGVRWAEVEAGAGAGARSHMAGEESGPPLGGQGGLVTAGFVIWGGLQGL